MANEIVITLQVDAQHAVNSIRTLKDEITQLNATLETLTASSEEYRDILDEIAGKQQALIELQLEAKVIQEELTESIEDETDGFQELIDILDEAIQSIDDYLDEMENGQETLSDLNEQIEEQSSQLEDLDESTVEYQITLEALIEVQLRYEEACEDMVDSSLDLEEMFAKIVETGSEMIEGLESIQKAAKNLGIESEFLTGAIGQLKNVMSLAQHMATLAGGVKKATTAVRALTAAMNANPVMALVSGVLLLVGALATFYKQSEEAASGVDILKESHEKYIDTLKDQQDEQDFTVRKLKAQGKSQREIIESNIKFTNNTIETTQARLEAIKQEIEILRARTKWYNFGNKKRLEELEAQQEDLEGILVKSNLKLEQLAKDHEIEVIKERKKARDKSSKDEQSYNDELLKIEEDRIKREKELEKSRTEGEARINYLKKEVKENRRLADEQLAISNDTGRSYAERSEALKQYQKLMAEGIKLNQELVQKEAEWKDELDRIAAEKKAREEQDEAEAEAERERLKELQEEQEEYERQKQIEEEEDRVKKQEMILEDLELEKEQLDARVRNLADLLAAEQLTNSERIRLMEEYQKALKAQGISEQKVADATIELEAAKRDAREETLNKATEALGKAREMLGEHTVAGKAAAVASAIIETYKAGNLALSSSPPPFSYVALAATIATGLANVKSILSVDVPDANDTTASVETPSLPSFPSSTEPIMETHNTMDAYDETFLNQSHKVYVTESDISSTQGKVSVSEAESSF